MPLSFEIQRECQFCGEEYVEIINKGEDYKIWCFPANWFVLGEIFVCPKHRILVDIQVDGMQFAKGVYTRQNGFAELGVDPRNPPGKSK